jgi:hypothetical protein
LGTFPPTFSGTVVTRTASWRWSWPGWSGIWGRWPKWRRRPAWKKQEPELVPIKNRTSKCLVPEKCVFKWGEEFFLQSYQCRFEKRIVGKIVQCLA